MRRWVYINRGAFVVFHRHEKIGDIIRVGTYEDVTLFEDEILADLVLDDVAIHRGFVADLEHHLEFYRDYHKFAYIEILASRSWIR